MTAIRDIRVGIAQNLSTIPGCQVSPYLLSSPTHPYLYVIPRGVTYDRTMHRGLDEIRMGVIAETSLGSGDRTAQELMDRFMESAGDYSVKQAVESDPTLGGAAADSRVEDIPDGYSVRAREGGGVVLWVEWVVRVYASGTA